MREIETVVAATDLGRASEPILDSAVRVAEAYGARLVICHIVEEMDQRYEFLSDTIQEELDAEAQEKIDAIHQAMKGRKVEVETIVRRGHVTNELLRVLGERRSDLTVLGAGTKDTVKERVLGTVAERISAKSVGDVLLVRPDSPTAFSNVVAAIDFSAPSVGALQRAIEVAVRFHDNEVKVIHSYDAPLGYQKAGVSYEEALAHAEKLARQDCEALITKIEKPEGFRLTPLLLPGSPHEVIEPALHEEGADLLVLGGRGQTAAASLLVGHVAARLARDTQCATWVTKQSGETMGVLKALTKMMGLQS